MSWRILLNVWKSCQRARGSAVVYELFVLCLYQVSGCWQLPWCSSEEFQQLFFPPLCFSCHLLSGQDTLCRDSVLSEQKETTKRDKCAELLVLKLGRTRGAPLRCPRGPILLETLPSNSCFSLGEKTRFCPWRCSIRADFRQKKPSGAVHVYHRTLRADRTNLTHCIAHPRAVMHLFWGTSNSAVMLWNLTIYTNS